MLAAGYLLIFIYVSFNLGRRNCVEHRIWLSTIGNIFGNLFIRIFGFLSSTRFLTHLFCASDFSPIFGFCNKPLFFKRNFTDVAFADFLNPALFRYRGCGYGYRFLLRTLTAPWLLFHRQTRYSDHPFVFAFLPMFKDDFP